jgi:beta-xylosidase
MKTITHWLPYHGAKVFRNPPQIHIDKEKVNGTEGLNPDPYVMEYNGEYYCFATGFEGVQVLHSTNLTTWNHLGYALQTDGERNFWAPSVIYHNGTFYMQLFFNI